MANKNPLTKNMTIFTLVIFSHMLITTPITYASENLDSLQDNNLSILESTELPSLQDEIAEIDTPISEDSPSADEDTSIVDEDNVGDKKPLIDSPVKTPKPLSSLRSGTLFHGTWGTTEWYIEDNVLYLTGGELAETSKETELPWMQYNELINSVRVFGNVKAPKNISYLFAKLNAKTINLDSMDLSDVEDMSDLFSDTPNLETVSMNIEQSTTKLTKIDDMFKTTKLTNVYLSKQFVLPDSMDTTVGFKSDTGEYTISNLIYGSGRIDLTKYGSSGVTGTVWWWKSKDNKEMHLLEGTLPSETNGDKPTPFPNIEDVTDLYFEETVDTHENAVSLFKDWTNLETVHNASRLDLSKAVNIEHLFYGNKKLTTMDTSLWDVSKVTNMGGTFQYTALKVIDTSKWTTGKLTNLWSTFESTQISVLDLSGFDAPSNTNIQDLFNNMNKVKKIIFGNKFKAKPWYPKHEGGGILANRWYYVGNGTINNPQDWGGALQYSGNKPDMYVPYNAKFNDPVQLWSSSPDADPTKNIGTYGEMGFVNKVSKENPWVDTISPDKTNESNLIKVQAKGIYGPDKDTGVKWYLDTDGVLHMNSGVLPNNDNYREIAPWDSSYADKINKIIIEGNITAAENSSFLFYNLKNLAEINNLNRLDISNVKNMKSMFMNDENLTTLDISEWNTQKVIDMSSMFKNAKSLQMDVNNLSKWNVSNVSYMNSMFENAESISDLNLDKWNVSTVVNMSSMFRNMKSLTTIKVGGWSPRKVKNMSFIFAGNTKQISADIVAWNVSSVVTMNSMFKGSGIINPDIHHWNVANVQDFNYIFADMKNLTIIEPNTWNTSSAISMVGMFMNADKLSSLDLSSWDTTKVTDMHDLFTGMPLLKKITFGNTFVTTQITESTKQADLPNTTRELQWRELGAGTINNPLGIWFVPHTISDTHEITAGTYVLDNYITTFNFTVKDKDGNIMPNISVSIKSSNGTEIASGNTDSNGVYSVELFMDTEYTATATDSEGNSVDKVFNGNDGVDYTLTLNNEDTYENVLPITGSNTMAMILGGLAIVGISLGVYALKKNRKELH